MKRSSRKLIKMDTRIIRNSNRAIFMQNALLGFIGDAKRSGIEKLYQTYRTYDPGLQYLGFSYLSLLTDFEYLIRRYSGL